MGVSQEKQQDGRALRDGLEILEKPEKKEVVGMAIIMLFNQHLHESDLENCSNFEKTKPFVCTQKVLDLF